MRNIFGGFSCSISGRPIIVWLVYCILPKVTSDEMHGHSTSVLKLDMLSSQDTDHGAGVGEAALAHVYGRLKFCGSLGCVRVRSLPS